MVIAKIKRQECLAHKNFINSSQKLRGNCICIDIRVKVKMKKSRLLWNKDRPMWLSCAFEFVYCIVVWKVGRVRKMFKYFPAD